MKKFKREWIFIIFSLLIMTIIVLTQDNIRQLFSLAAPRKANIRVDVKNVSGPLDQNWQSFAQGGEEPPPMLSPVVDKIKLINPQYIRLDHIYDYYDIVKKANGGYVFDFSLLDQTVNDILAMGALPFFSLSYMPSAFTPSGSVIDSPTDWNNWKNLVRATVEHYSGKSNRNLSKIYYEVWNEPDLPQFGNWKLYPDKDYRILYFHASKGANEARNTNVFSFGGPAAGSFYANWVSGFISYVEANDLRLDFYSWHRYHRNTQMFEKDAVNIRNILKNSSRFANLPLVLSEWGIESENNPINNSDRAAAFTVNSISKFFNEISLAFTFEVKDGPPPKGGIWGLVTHEKNPDHPLSVKPRYQVFKYLSKLKGHFLNLYGEGTFVSGIASKDEQTTTLVLGNYDPSNNNTEDVPVTFTGLNPSSYRLNYVYPLTGVTGNFDIVSTNGSISKSFLMPPNSVIYVELIPGGKLANFIPGANNGQNDQALVLNNLEAPINFLNPEFRLLPEESVSFDIKPFWDKNDRSSFIILDSPYSTEIGKINKIYLAKQYTPDGNELVFGITSESESKILNLRITDWDSNNWYHVIFGWHPHGIYLSEGVDRIEISGPVDIRNGRIMTLYSLPGAIDNISIKIAQTEILRRSFDGRVEQ